MSKITKSRVRLSVEALEERANPSYVSGGTLFIQGTYGNDTVTVHYSPGSVSGNWITPPRINVIQNGVTTSHTYFPFGGSPINRIAFYGYGGNDYFNDYSNTVPVTAYGMDGNDTLMGYDHGDSLDGGNGDDVLYGYGGDDTLAGGDGQDTLYGMDGNDDLRGGQDYYRDVYVGGAGADRFQREIRWYAYESSGYYSFYSENIDLSYEWAYWEYTYWDTIGDTYY